MSPILVALDPHVIRQVQSAYLDARDRGALYHTAFDAAVLALREMVQMNATAAREVVARILPSVP